MLSECREAMTRTLDTAAVELLRAIFDLADADVRPTPNLLGRLLEIDVDRAKGLIAGLRRTGLVQHERLGLTMAGLAVAASVAPTELRPMQAPVRPVRALWAA